MPEPVGTAAHLVTVGLGMLEGLGEVTTKMARGHRHVQGWGFSSLGHI